MNKARLIHCFDAGMVRTLAEAGVARHFHYWRGKSGAKRLFTVFAHTSIPDYEGAVVVLTRPDADGRVPVWVGLSDDAGLPALAEAKGATEAHMHLMATDAAARQALLDDFISLSDIREVIPAPTLACSD